MDKWCIFPDIGFYHSFSYRYHIKINSESYLPKDVGTKVEAELSCLYVFKAKASNRVLYISKEVYNYDQSKWTAMSIKSLLLFFVFFVWG